MNKSFEDIYAFTPLTKKEMHALSWKYLPLLKPRFIKILKNKENQVIAFVVTIAVCFLFTVSGMPIVLNFFSGWTPQALLDTIASFSFISNFTDLTQGVIDIRNIKELNFIKEESNNIVIGSTTNHYTVASSDLIKNKLSKSFVNFHLIPMVSAIWSMPPYEASKMPLKFFLKFFQNHGLFKLKNRPQWYTVAKRSRTYVAKVLSSISGEYYKNYNVNRLIRRSNGIDLYYGDKSEFFSYDKVVLASHADQALSILDEPTKEEQEILSKFKYRENIAVIHTDESIMPNNKDIWSSWNSSVDKNNVENNSITYWLNLLQNLDFNKNIFLTLNPNFKINEDKILKKVNFTHPYFDQSALDNQDKLKNLQNKKNLLFCGSYFGYGFHEDGIKSSIEMIKAIDD